MYATRRGRLCQKNLMFYESYFERLQFEGKIGFDEKRNMTSISMVYRLVTWRDVGLSHWPTGIGGGFDLVLFHYKTRTQESEL
jgi:hypothetical protein